MRNKRNILTWAFAAIVWLVLIGSIVGIVKATLHRTRKQASVMHSDYKQGKKKIGKKEKPIFGKAIMNYRQSENIIDLRKRTGD